MGVVFLYQEKLTAIYQWCLHHYFIQVLKSITKPALTLTGHIYKGTQAEKISF